MGRRVVLASAILAGFAHLAGCGSFAGEPGAPSPVADAGEAGPTAQPDAMAPDGVDAAAVCASPACGATDFGCAATGFDPAPPDNEAPWSYEGTSGKPVVQDGVLVAHAPNGEPAFLRTSDPSSPHVRLTTELDVAVDDIGANSLVGVVAWIGPASDEVFVGANAKHELVVCPLPVSGSEKPCSPPVARWEPGKWVHVAWTVEQAAGGAVASRVAFDCAAPSIVSFDGITLATSSTSTTIELHAGVTVSYGTGSPAAVRIDNVYRRVERL